jgi:hypothetical protein
MNSSKCILLRFQLLIQCFKFYLQIKFSFQHFQSLKFLLNFLLFSYIFIWIILIYNLDFDVLFKHELDIYQMAIIRPKNWFKAGYQLLFFYKFLLFVQFYLHSGVNFSISSSPSVPSLFILWDWFEYVNILI